MIPGYPETHMRTSCADNVSIIYVF